MLDCANGQQKENQEAADKVGENCQQEGESDEAGEASREVSEE